MNGIPPLVLTIDSASDDAAKVGWAVREQILYPFIRDNVGRLVRLQGTHALRSIVAPAAAAAGVRFLIGVSHGLQDCYKGFNDDDLFRIGQYTVAEVDNRVIHWTACQTANLLGPDMIGRGAAAFFGYIGDFVFPPQLAQILFDCDAEIDRALLEGQTAGDAQRRAIDRFNLYIQKLTNAGQFFFAQCLQVNRDRLRGPLEGLGNPNASIR